MPGFLTDSVRDQIEGLDLDQTRPLILCDADEVLFQFVRSLDIWLRTRGLYLDLQSFAITGNIKNVETDTPWPAENIKPLLKDFFLEDAREEIPVPGAAAALKDLSSLAQIVVLTNVADGAREARRAALIKCGMPYPVVANQGAKGAAASALAERTASPIVFLDDLPPNISSVRRGLPEAHIIHFIGDPRLASMIGKAPDADHRIDDWPQAAQVIKRVIRDHG
jgi:hypothetical protein